MKKQGHVRQQELRAHVYSGRGVGLSVDEQNECPAFRFFVGPHHEMPRWIIHEKKVLAVLMRGFELLESKQGRLATEALKCEEDSIPRAHHRHGQQSCRCGGDG